MLQKFVHKYLQDPFFYFKIILKQLKLFIEYPIYVSREFLNIIRSLISSILSKSFRTNIFFRKLNGINFFFNFNYKQVFRMRTMFFGMVQTNAIRVFLKYIKKGTVFIDVGASIGYMSAIGAGLVGKKGQVHSFEPLPENFKKLMEMAELNNNYQIYVNNYALGENISIGTMDVSEVYGFGWNTLVPNWINPDHVKKRINVNIRRLDEYLIEKDIKNISLIKIDVEGFEFPVLKGLTKYFKKNKDNLPPILVEISPVANSKLGYNLGDLENFMKKYSYYAFYPDEKSRTDIKKLVHWRDILFIQIK